MKAVCLHQATDIAIIDIPRKETEQEIEIQVNAVGICGSDIAAYKGISPMVTYPRILGHEVAGTITQIPQHCEGFAVGNRVIVEPYMYCGQCYPCNIGRTNCCENMNVIGVHQDGGMSEYYAHPPTLIHKVPDSLLWEHVPMVEPLSIAIHGVHRLDVKAGEHVAITGAGPIGLLAAQVVQHFDAVPILIDPLEKRLNLAREIGIKHIVNPVNNNLVEQILTLTGGRLVEAFLEASGAAPAIKSTLELIRYAGRIAFLGWPKEEIALPTYLITKKELDVRGSRNSVREFPLAIELLATSAVKVDQIITHIIPFDDIAEYIKKIAEFPADYVKVIAKTA